MTKLPVLSGKDVIKALSQAGFVVARQKRSHVILKKVVSGETVTTVVPLHQELDRGTLVEIIRQARLQREEFLKLLG